MSDKFAMEEDFKIEKIDFVPKPRIKSLLSFRYDDPKSVQPINEQIKNFFVGYVNNTESQATECSFDDHFLYEHESCHVDMTSFGDCVTSDQSFGYEKASPCVFIKFKKREDWKPSFFTLEELKLNGLSEKYVNFIKDDFAAKNPAYLKTIWVECRGKEKIDRTLLGSVTYHPMQGFPEFYFPFTKDQKFYQEPIVAVQFNQPRSEFEFSL